MKEGLLLGKIGHIFPYDELETYLFGFNNRYALIARRALGGGKEAENTLDADKDLFEATPIGIGLKASEIKRLPENEYKLLLEMLSDEEIKKIVLDEKMQTFRSRFDLKKRRYQSISREEIDVMLDRIKNLDEREAIHEVRSLFINPNYKPREEREE